MRFDQRHVCWYSWFAAVRNGRSLHTPGKGRNMLHMLHHSAVHCCLKLDLRLGTRGRVHSYQIRHLLLQGLRAERVSEDSDVEKVSVRNFLML